MRDDSTKIMSKLNHSAPNNVLQYEW